VELALLLNQDLLPHTPYTTLQAVDNKLILSIGVAPRKKPLPANTCTIPKLRALESLKVYTSGDTSFFPGSCVSADVYARLVASGW